MTILPPDPLSFFSRTSRLQELKLYWEGETFVVHVLREDLLHPAVSGNKLRKLRNFVQQALRENTGMYSFGGAYSNHVAALAAAGQLFGIPTAAIIRGEELHPESNMTLKIARDQGMQLHFVSRSDYRRRGEISNWKERFGIPPDWLEVPEGGRGASGMAGVSDWAANHLCGCKGSVALACGTGTTAEGILRSGFPGELWVYPVVRDQSVWRQLDKAARNCNGRLFRGTLPAEWRYGRLHPVILPWIAYLYREHEFLLDPVYTAPAFFAFWQDICRGQVKPPYFFIHTGGLQGWNGFPQAARELGLQ